MNDASFFPFQFNHLRANIPRLPESFRVEVHEEGAGTAHIVLPPDSRLGEADLQVATGSFGTAPEEIQFKNWF